MGSGQRGREEPLETSVARGFLCNVSRGSNVGNHHFAMFQIKFLQITSSEARSWYV